MSDPASDTAPPMSKPELEQAAEAASNQPLSTAASEPAPQPDALQELCELGQQHLMAMQYLDAEAALERAEVMAL